MSYTLLAEISAYKKRKAEREAALKEYYRKMKEGKLYKQSRPMSHADRTITAAMALAFSMGSIKLSSKTKSPRNGPGHGL